MDENKIETDNSESMEYYKRIYDEIIKQQQQMHPILKPKNRRVLSDVKYKFEEHAKKVLAEKPKHLKIKEFLLEKNFKLPNNITSILQKINRLHNIYSGTNNEIIFFRENINIKDFIRKNLSNKCCLDKNYNLSFNYEILNKKETRQERFKYNYKVHVIQDNDENTKIILKVPTSFYVVDIVEFITERNIYKKINTIITQNICPNFVKCYYGTQNNLLINKLENNSNIGYEPLPIFLATEFYEGALTDLFYELKIIYIIGKKHNELNKLLNKKLRNICNLSSYKMIEIGFNLEIINYDRIKNYSLIDIINNKWYHKGLLEVKLKDILNKETQKQFNDYIDLLNEFSLKKIIKYCREPILTDNNLYEIIYSILFQMVAGIYILNTKMNTMINNLIIHEIGYKKIDKRIIFKYVINDKEYYIKTFGYLIIYSNLSKCLNPQILNSEYIKTSPNYEQLKNTYIKYKDGNYQQFKNIKLFMTEFKYRFTEPYELLEKIFEKPFGPYKHNVRHLYYSKIKKDIYDIEYKKIKEEVDEEHPELDVETENKDWKQTTKQDFIDKKMNIIKEELKNDALYEISKNNLNAFIKIATYLKYNTFDISTVNNFYRETFRNRYYTDNKFNELYPSFYENYLFFKDFVLELTKITIYDNKVFEDYFSVFQKPIDGDITTFNLDKIPEINFEYDDTITINTKLIRKCPVDLLFNYELSIPRYTTDIKPDNIRITKNINKIYTFSDIHGDIIPLIINLRDCSCVIRKKEKKSFDKLKKQDYDALCELKKTHEKLYLNVEENIRYDGEDKYIDDLNYEWCGNDAIAVICGDFMDNGRQNKMSVKKKVNEFPMEEAKILMFINAINKQAIQFGGRIFKILGNHEERNISIMWKENKENYNLYEYQSNYANASGEDGIENYPRINNVPLELDFLSNRERFFLPSKPGALLLAEDTIFVLLAIKNFVFVHWGISNKNISIKNINFINNFINYYLIKGDIYKDLLFDINLSKEEAFVVYELLINKISIPHDPSFGYINNIKKSIKDSSTEEQCLHLQERLDILFNDLINYTSNELETVLINPSKYIFLEENYKGDDNYSCCIGNFWFGIDNLENLNNNLNMVMGGYTSIYKFI